MNLLVRVSSFISSQSRRASEGSYTKEKTRTTDFYDDDVFKLATSQEDENDDTQTEIVRVINSQSELSSRKSSPAGSDKSYGHKISTTRPPQSASLGDSDVNGSRKVGAIQPSSENKPVPIPRKKISKSERNDGTSRESERERTRDIYSYDSEFSTLSNGYRDSVETRRKFSGNDNHKEDIVQKQRRQGLPYISNANVRKNSDSSTKDNFSVEDYASYGYNDDFDYHVTFSSGCLNQSNHIEAYVNSQSNQSDNQQIDERKLSQASNSSTSSQLTSRSSTDSKRKSHKISIASSQTDESDFNEAATEVTDYPVDDVANLTIHELSFDDSRYEIGRDHNHNDFNQAVIRSKGLSSELSGLTSVDDKIANSQQNMTAEMLSRRKMRSGAGKGGYLDNGTRNVNNNFYKMTNEDKPSHKGSGGNKSPFEGSLQEADDRSNRSMSTVLSDSADDHNGSVVDFSVGSVQVTREILRKYDITGLQEPARFPWQHDVGIQCEILSVRSAKRAAQFGLPRAAQLKENHFLSGKESLSSLEEDGSNYEVREISRRSEYIKDVDQSAILADDNVSKTRVVFDPPLKRLDNLLYSTAMNAPTQAGYSHGRGSIEHETIVEESEVEHENSDEFENKEDRDGVLKSSTTMSPIPWQPSGLAGEHLNSAVTSLMEQSRKAENLQKKALRQANGKNGSTGGDTSDESDDGEQQLPVVSTYRRERRSAVIDTKNVGDVSPGNLTPASSDEDLDDSPKEIRRRHKTNMTFPRNHASDQRRRLAKRNTVSDFTVSGNVLPLALEQDDSKRMKSFSFLKLIDRKRGKDNTPPLDHFFANYKQSIFKDNNLARYKNVHWSEIIATSDKHGDSLAISETERKRREAVWELFTSECVFLVDHLMILKHCFLEPLKKAQVEGLLMIAEPHTLFGNIDEICYVSYMFCKDFISSLLKDMSPTEFGRTEVLINSFKKLTEHSKNGEVYHNYCLNYSNALSHLENLRKNEEFYEFEKWCEKDPRCRKLVITDFLVAPMQHWTKMPLLLSNIRKYTDDIDERIHLTSSLESVINSLEKLEDKMKWLKNFERIQKVQSQLVWPPVTDMEHRAFVPESLRSVLNKQPCERLLASPKRQLLCEGLLSLVENSKTSDAYIFLFDDILLVTKIKKPPKKKHTSENLANVTTADYDANTEGAVFVVHRQPIALDRFSVHDIGQNEASANGLKNVLCLVQITRFQQIIGVYTLQAPNEATKATWLKHLRDAKEKYAEAMGSNKTPNSPYAPLPGSPRLNANRSPRRLRKLNMLKQLHERAKSMDVIQLPASNGQTDYSGSAENLDKLQELSETTEPVFL